MAADRHPKLRGGAGWVIIGVAVALVIVFAVFVVMGSTFFPPGSGPETETAQESATSGPGFNTTNQTETPAL
jgi:hypothetical protein